LVNLDNPDPKTCNPVNSDCGTDRVTGAKHKICIDNHNGTYSAPPSRAQINAGAMAGREIGQVDSPQQIADADLEGSASLQFGSATPVALNYVSDNGMHGFYPRQIMACAGATAAERKAGWNAFLQAHAARKTELLNYNESIIFWNPSEPKGVDGISLTKGVSLATNLREIPTGAVTMYNTARPGKNSKECSQRTSMGISQDKGGAITDNHVDVYTGEGIKNETTGHVQAYDDAQVNDPGSLFVAVPPNAGTPIANCQD
jgi:membrane-bound lytic murein transglycosylase